MRRGFRTNLKQQRRKNQACVHSVSLHGDWVCCRWVWCRLNSSSRSFSFECLPRPWKTGQAAQSLLSDSGGGGSKQTEGPKDSNCWTGCCMEGSNGTTPVDYDVCCPLHAKTPLRLSHGTSCRKHESEASGIVDQYFFIQTRLPSALALYTCVCVCVCLCFRSFGHNVPVTAKICPQEGTVCFALNPKP